MKNDVRWQLVPILLVVAGSISVLVVAITHRLALGQWQWPIYVGAALAILGSIGFRRKLTAGEQDLERAQQNLSEREASLTGEQQQLTTLQSEFQTDMDGQVKQLDRREKDLTDRLIAYREWMEFPGPIDLNAPQPTDEELHELAEMDRRTFELLTEQTRVFFDNIRQNKYLEDGRLKPSLIRDDLYELATQVARIYRGDAEDPLLETSLAQILTALSRACLHFQVVLEELPLNVKDYSLKSLYGYVRTAVKAYGVYKSAEPLLSFANHAFYLTRLAMGGSPVTLGAYWFLSMVGREGTKAVTNRVVNRQALSLLHNVVRVIGCEVAGIYGGDFRHRDPNWIYAIELVEVMRRLPTSRESLSAAMQEIGVLQFRNEYDRIFLYRCLASGKGVDPGPYRPDVVLNNEERQAIATRLERFLATHFVDLNRTPAIEEWRDKIELRLNLKIDVDSSSTPAASMESEVNEALRSLASFLLGVKQLEVEQLGELLACGHLFRTLPENRQTAILAELTENPPYFFEHPNVNARSVVADQYLEDLVELEVQSTPRDGRVESMLENVAAYLRRDANEVHEILKRRFQNRLIDRIPDLPAPREIDTPIARAIMDLLDHSSQPLFLYDNVEIRSEGETVQTSLWLLGTSEELFLIQSTPSVEVLWRGNSTNASCECSRQYLQRSCRVRGGKWLQDVTATAEIVLSGGWFSSIEASFQALLLYFEPTRTT